MSFFAINLKKLRTAKKLSQQKFAELFGMTRSTVGAYEEGRAEPKLDKIIEIAGYFKLSVDQLISKPLTISDIFHLDKKINQNKITSKTDFIRYSKLKDYIAAKLKDRQPDTEKIEIPGINADIAFENSRGDIFFCTTGSTMEEGKTVIVCKDGILTENFESLEQNNILEIWDIKYILSPSVENYDKNEKLLKEINKKIDFLVELHKKQK